MKKIVLFVALLLAALVGVPGNAQIGPNPGSNITTFHPEQIYVTGQAVVFQGVIYQSLVNNNQGWNPATSPSQWSTVFQTGSDTRPRATTSTVFATVAANSSCVISVSPATAGQQTVAACQTGTAAGPGTLTHVHLTLGPTSDNANILQNSTLTFLCDGTSQTVPLGTFFMTLDNPLPFSTDWNADSIGTSAAGNFSGNRRMEFNFNTGCQVTFTNASVSNSVVLFGEVDYRLGANNSRPSRKYWHMLTQPLTSVAQYANFSMLPTVRDSGGGELESITLFTSSPTNGSTLEGYTTVTVDGNAAVQANGTEDFFGSGYFGVNSVNGHFSPKWGEFYSSGIGSVIGITSHSLQNPAQTYDALLYRNFQTDDRENALFTNNLAVFQPNGEATKPGASPPGTVSMQSLVTFWTHDPMAATPTFSPAAGGASPSTTVTMSSATPGATICSTTDGSTPAANAGTCTSGSPGPTVVISPPVTVNALASKSGFADSFVSSAAYTTTVGGTYTFGLFQMASSGGSSVTSITSPAITVTAGDFVFGLCQQAALSGGTTSTISSPANTFHQLTVSSTASGTVQGFYSLSAGAGSTTFTCNFGQSNNFAQVFVYTFHHSGVSAAFISGTDVSAGLTCASSASCTSGTFSTGAVTPGLVAYCGSIPANETWTAGNIGGSASTLQGTASSIGDACEFLTSASGALTGATSSIAVVSTHTWNIAGAAFQ